MMPPRQTPDALARLWALVKSLGGPAVVVGSIVFLVRLDASVRHLADEFSMLNATVREMVVKQATISEQAASATTRVDGLVQRVDRHEQMLDRLLRPVATP